MKGLVSSGDELVFFALLEWNVYHPACLKDVMLA
jgi:hypothetical protein